MEKHILEQYTDLQKEEKDIKKRIDRINIELTRMEEKGYKVADSVTCGKRGKKPLGTRRVEGFPYPGYEAKRSQLRNLKRKLELTDDRLLELTNEVEDYIQSIPGSQIRRIMRYRYFDDLTWMQVARRMGGRWTPDSCRITHDRFLEKN